MFPKLNELTTLIFIPLVVLTALELKKKWRSVWDRDLTADDRSVLLRVAFVMILPLLVLVHELGHALAVWHFGGKVVGFDYGFIWGKVTWTGSVDPAQHVLVALAGNLLMVVAALALLAGALIASSPPVVALLIYSGMLAIGATAVMYPLMSAAGLYGDWVQIYLIPAGALNWQIGAIHLLLVGAYLYALFSSQTRLWFARKTDARFDIQYQRWTSQLSLAPTAESWINLGICFLGKGLFSLAAQAAEEAYKLEPSAPDVAVLQGDIAFRRGRYDQSIREYRRVAEDLSASGRARALCWLSIGQAHEKLGRLNEATKAFERAMIEDPFLAEPRLYKASLLLMRNNPHEALKELTALSQLDAVWMDSGNSKRVSQLMKTAEQALSASRQS